MLPGAGNLATKRARIESGELALHGLADIAVLRGIERLDLEFTFPIRGRNIEPEFPSKLLGTGKFANTAMLIRLTTDFQPDNLPGVEEVVVLSSMVPGRVCESFAAVQAVDFK